MFRLIIATSSSFTDYELFRTKLEHLLQNQQDVELCAGFSTAGNTMINRYASETNRQVKPFDPGFRGMYQALIYAQAAVFFHDGSSCGVAKYIEQARQCKLKVKVINFTHDLDKAIPAGRPRKRNMVVIDGQELVPDVKPKSRKPASSGQTVFKYDYKKMYHEAHEQWFQKEYPSAWKDGHYTPKKKVPDVTTANGLASYIIDHTGWTGNYANRINVMGRQVGGITRTQSGAMFDDRKYIKASTRKGTTDLDIIIQGHEARVEIKIGADKQSHDQIKMEAKIKRAGGTYQLWKSVDDYIEYYYSCAGQRELFDK